MPVSVMELDEARRYLRDYSFYPVEKKWDPQEAERIISDIVHAGFPEPDVVLVNAGTSILGLEEEGKSWIFGNAPLEQVLWHEEGHKVQKVWLHWELEPYYAIRGDIPENVLVNAPYSEVFPEDFRLLFGTEGARRSPHAYAMYVGDVGFSFAPIVQQLLGFTAKQNALREYIMSKKPASVPVEPIVPSNQIRLVIGSRTYTVGTQTYQMDTAPFLKDGRTFVPIRFVAEAMNCQVDWKETGRDQGEVIITPK